MQQGQERPVFSTFFLKRNIRQLAAECKTATKNRLEEIERILEDVNQQLSNQIFKKLLTPCKIKGKTQNLIDGARPLAKSFNALNRSVAIVDESVDAQKLLGLKLMGMGKLLELAYLSTPKPKALQTIRLRSKFQLFTLFQHQDQPQLLEAYFSHKVNRLLSLRTMKLPTQQEVYSGILQEEKVDSRSANFAWQTIFAVGITAGHLYCVGEAAIYRGNLSTLEKWEKFEGSLEFPKELAIGAYFQKNVLYVFTSNYCMLKVNGRNFERVRVHLRVDNFAVTDEHYYFSTDGLEQKQQPAEQNYWLTNMERSQINPNEKIILRCIKDKTKELGARSSKSIMALICQEVAEVIKIEVKDQQCLVLAQKNDSKQRTLLIFDLRSQRDGQCNSVKDYSFGLDFCITRGHIFVLFYQEQAQKSILKAKKLDGDIIASGQFIETGLTFDKPVRVTYWSEVDALTIQEGLDLTFYLDIGLG